MQVVCEATQSTSIPVQVGAFECLVRIMHLYYEKMALYMERALFGVSGGGLFSYFLFRFSFLFSPHIGVKGDRGDNRR